MTSKLVRKILGTGLLAGSLVGAGGCTLMEDIVNDPLPRFLQSGSYRDRKESEKGPWAGTAVVNRIVNPDGSVIFIIDAIKIGESIDTDYADKFLDARRYNKTWERNGIYGFIITYIPKQKDNKQQEQYDVKKIYKPGDTLIVDGIIHIKTDKGYWIPKKE